MIIKVLSTILVFIHVVHTIPQFNLADGILNTIDSVSKLSNATSVNPSELLNKTSDVVKVAVDSTQRITDSLKGFIENFTDFKTIFNKTYLSEIEEKLREQVFKVNLALIFAHNDQFKEGKQSYSLAMNSYGDWTHDEYLKILGVNTSNTHFSNGTSSSSKIMHRHSRSVDCQNPVEKDWRKDGAVTPVKHQLDCGSCWAFASTGTFEAHYFLKYGKLQNFSEQQLVDCAASEGKGCDGAFMYAAYEYAKENGIVTNETYPYTGTELGAQNKCKTSSGSNVKISYFEPVDQNEAAVKDAVCRFGPVPCVIDGASKEFRFYHGGIYRNRDCSTNPSDGNHAMLIVGYGTDSETNEPYWLVKNSYGATWGEGGYVRILRDPKYSCGIEKLVSYPVF